MKTYMKVIMLLYDLKNYLGLDQKGFQTCFQLFSKFKQYLSLRLWREYSVKAYSLMITEIQWRSEGGHLPPGAKGGAKILPKFFF